MFLISPMRFDPASGSMIADPRANTAEEHKKMLDWQKENGALLAKRTPVRKAKRAQEQKLAAGRQQLVGTRSVADIRAGRAARKQAAREAAERARVAADSAVSELDQQRAELEATAHALEAKAAELKRASKDREQKERELARREKQLEADAQSRADQAAELSDLREQVAELAQLVRGKYEPPSVEVIGPIPKHEAAGHTPGHHKKK
jgi:hypothetical protein